eukprot:gene5034-6135_t
MSDKPLMTETGSNKEKEDLKEPLTITSKDQITKVVLHQSHVSPPCCKIRAILKRYDVPFEIVEGKKPDSDYKKIPVLMVNERQINDSFIMVKSLAPILDGQALSPELLELEELNTFGLMIALELEIAESGSELRKCSPLVGGKKNPGLKTVKEYGVKFAEKLK